MTPQKKRMIHNYTSELELKSLLIRIKNDRENVGDSKYNKRINKYIKWHTAAVNEKYKYPAKRNIVKNKLKEAIIRLSEQTSVDSKSYERFGEIILLMIKNILKKPQFSGYTYKDDFYSDAVYKILKYLGNFNHTLISERSGQEVKAFAYISTIIHHSILYILNTKKKESERLKNKIHMEQLNYNLQLKNHDLIVEEDRSEFENEKSSQTIELNSIDGTLKEEIERIKDDIDMVDEIIIIYPKTYQITFEEYSDLKSVIKGNISIIRAE